ncbi:MAG: LysR family transcriptional regulator [Gammaproteobacteria bacterium]|nr:LysR family transcriptional regulator [Gammaproteobacteria bacterium]
MLNRLPPLKPLRAFEATARTGSVTAAATELNVTHSAVSHQIKTLESALGTPLFDRRGQRLRLTAQGALLLPAVSQAFQTIGIAAEQVNRPTTSGRLSVTCPPALLSYWLIPRLDDFTQRYPEVQFQLRPSTDEGAPLSPGVDLGIVYGQARQDDCWVRLWSRIELFPVMSPRHLNRQSVRSLKDLPKQVLLHADDGHEWHIWLSQAEALDLAPRRQHYLGGARVALDAALNGHGLALGDTLTSVGLLDSGDLVAPLALSVPASDAFYIVCRQEVRQTVLADVFIRWLFDAIGQDISTQQSVG